MSSLQQPAPQVILYASAGSTATTTNVTISNCAIVQTTTSTGGQVIWINGSGNASTTGNGIPAVQWVGPVQTPTIAPPPADAMAFNRFVNASDLLEEFIAFCGAERVSKQQLLKLPMKLFIQWLVLEAARADGEDPPEDTKLVEDLRCALDIKNSPAEAGPSEEP